MWGRRRRIEYCEPESVFRPLAARGASPAACDRRRVSPGCVAPRSNTAGLLPRRALPNGRVIGLAATLDLHHELLAPRDARRSPRISVHRSVPGHASSRRHASPHLVADPAPSSSALYTQSVSPVTGSMGRCLSQIGAHEQAPTDHEWRGQQRVVKPGARGSRHAARHRPSSSARRLPAARRSPH